MSKVNVLKSNRWIFGVMLFFGVCGLIAAWSLSVERIQQLQDPNAQLICNFNLIFNCGKVMTTWQAKLFGFPNSFIGQMAFPVVITVAVAALAGAKLPRKFMRAANIAYLLGAIFAYWLFFQSVYVIQVLCPWCLLVTFSCTMLLETITRYNIREGNLGLPKKLQQKALAFIEKDYDKLLTAAWVVLLVSLVFMKFGSALFN